MFKADGIQIHEFKFLRKVVCDFFKDNAAIRILKS